MVVLLCCIAFSLSVDYEIFLLSRIKEARDAGLSNNDAIVVGLARVGRIISSAALLLTITLLSFANGLSFMKMFGIGTALAIVIDATVIRGVVVPAFLRVAGDLNWWAPRPLRWLHARIGFSEAPSYQIPSTAEHDEDTQRLRPIHPAEPDTVRHPRQTPQHDDETRRLPRIRTPEPEPDTIRHPRQTPQHDDETRRLPQIRIPEPDTVRHPTPEQTSDVDATIPARSGLPSGRPPDPPVPRPSRRRPR
jgi:RND superfamily putative drug exporter